MVTDGIRVYVFYFLVLSSNYEGVPLSTVLVFPSLEVSCVLDQYAVVDYSIAFSTLTLLLNVPLLLATKKMSIITVENFLCVLGDGRIFTVRKSTCKNC